MKMNGPVQFGGLHNVIRSLLVEKLLPCVRGGTHKKSGECYLAHFSPPRHTRYVDQHGRHQSGLLCACVRACVCVHVFVCM